MIADAHRTINLFREEGPEIREAGEAHSRQPDTQDPGRPGDREGKKGDLRGVFVHKFKIHSTQYLLAYRFVGGNLELIMIGPHENYYRDLSGYMKSR